MSLIKNYLLFGFCLFFFSTSAQKASVHESTYGLQTNTVGLWLYNETGLSNTIALRSEIGIAANIVDVGGGYSLPYDSEVSAVGIPRLTLEPRYYYNLEKRHKKLRRTKTNSGNYLSLKTTWYPNWFLLSRYNDLEIVHQIHIVPKWGIRRTFSARFNFEAGAGLGYQYIFWKSAGYSQNEGDLVIDLHLRIGLDL